MTHHEHGALRRVGTVLAGGVFVAGCVGAGSTPAVAAVGDTFSISGSLGTVLFPGVEGPLDLTITNPTGIDLRLATLTVTIDSVTPAACALSNFAVGQAVLPTPPTALMPAHSARTLSAMGLTGTQLPRVRMLETGVSQNECQGAALHLLYNGTAIGQNGQFPGGGNSDGDGHDGDGHDHDGHHHDWNDGDNHGSGSGTGSADLPGTGGNGHEGDMAAAGLGLVGVGAAFTWIVRRRKGAGA